MATGDAGLRCGGGLDMILAPAVLKDLGGDGERRRAGEQPIVEFIAGSLGLGDGGISLGRNDGLSAYRPPYMLCVLV